jgi:chemosensory pili system protein ChpA (sensor histidine kinase/response regulator)
MISALVIEDSRSTSDSMCKMLKMLKIIAVPAYSPRAAFIQIDEAIPNIIFLDINLPTVDGFEVLSYLRRDPRLEKIPVIIVTSNDQPEIYRRAEQGKAQEVIIKPATLESLQKALRKAGLLA